MSLLRWIQYDILGRQTLLPGLLSLTRLHQLPASALEVETHSLYWRFWTILGYLLFVIDSSFLLLLTSFHQTLRESDTPLCDDESCLTLLSEAESRQSQYSGLLTDARPATTQSYIYIHKTEENGEIRHTFCYCLEKDQWKDLATGHGEGTTMMPDPPGSCLTSYAEKVLQILD